MQISAAKQNPDSVSLPTHEKALLKFVLKSVRDPALTRQNEIDALCEHRAGVTRSFSMRSFWGG
jgi:hypothetical protein